MTRTENALRVLADQCLVIGQDLEAVRCTADEARERLDAEVRAALERVTSSLVTGAVEGGGASMASSGSWEPPERRHVPLDKGAPLPGRGAVAGQSTNVDLEGTLAPEGEGQ